MLKFKDANPDSRIPVYLQNHTKENIVWQFKLLGVYLVGMWAWDEIQTRGIDKRVMKRIKSLKK